MCVFACVFMMINVYVLNLYPLFTSQIRGRGPRKNVLLPEPHLDTEQHTALLILAWGSQHLSLPMGEMKH